MSSATVSPPCKRPRLTSPHNSYRGHDSATLTSPFQRKHSQPPAAGENQGDGRWNRSPRRARRPEYELAYTFKGHAAGVSSVKFSPDGKWIASCCKFVCVDCEGERVRKMRERYPGRGGVGGVTMGL